MPKNIHHIKDTWALSRETFPYSYLDPDLEKKFWFVGPHCLKHFVVELVWGKGRGAGGCITPCSVSYTRTLSIRSTRGRWCRKQPCGQFTGRRECLSDKVSDLTNFRFRFINVTIKSALTSDTHSLWLQFFRPRTISLAIKWGLGFKDTKICK